MRDSNLLTNSDIKRRVFESLWLSYFLLSDDLKQCFLLCSIFPKGYYMDKAHLISQWITHGFVSSGNGSRQLEDIGSDYFDSLLKVSFLQDLDEDMFSGRVTCKMHDLVHELTRQILKDEITVIPTNSTNDHNQICRYLSVASSTEKVERKLFNKLRALFVMGGSFSTDKPIKKGYCVRSVILEDIRRTFVPLSVSNFEYLGYLRISNSSFQELPEAITDCWNLQALHVIMCYRFAMLPESIGKLRKLRTLELSHVGDLESLPQSIGDCHSLESLRLIDCSEFKKIPDSFCQNENLRLLNIVDCSSLLHLPSRSFQKLRNLETINLSGCINLEDLPGSFACGELHTLKLCELTKLTLLSESITSLSNLKHLDLKGCRGLVELPAGIVSLRRLVVLNLKGCDELRGLPAGLGELTRLETLGLFVAGDSSEHARISELGSLDRLSGKLKICIRFVKDPDDAEKANLKQKNNIHGLQLSFWNMEIEMEQEAHMELEMAVLNFLEPPSGIEWLSICCYKGSHFPRWLTKKWHLSNLDRKFEQTVDPPHFPHLTRMTLRYHPNVKHLTGLVELPSLERLSLDGFDTLESINIGPFPSLAKLSIHSVPHSLELTTATRAILVDSDGLPKMECCFPRLSDLVIYLCPKLNLDPCFPASLESLRLYDSTVWPVHPLGDKSESPSCSNSNGVSLCSTLLSKLRIRGPSCTSGWEFLQHLGALESLKIVDCDEELKQLPESMRTLTTLQVQRLKITSCSGLCVLPGWLGELRSLQSLKISDCINLRVLSEGWLGELVSLQKLEIHHCINLRVLSNEWLGELRSLQVLKISSCPSLRELPEGIQHLASLHELSITCCDALHQLPEFGSGELRSLALFGLPCVSHLPESMRSLTSLQELRITECGALELPEGLGELPSLRRLEIQKLPLLTSLPVSLQDLINLEYLYIYDCEAFDQLPDQLGKLRSLQTLFIWRLPLLTCLPESIGQLCALRELSIYDCPGLTSLPSSIQRLTGLQTLHMIGNPDLAKRYKQGAGKDWHLISHIPDVVIN
uniref:Uncharacterized protein n=1 Tax=Avena sativa TaxID=4498 RepID=A0ACD5XVU5_AVESA